MEEQLFDEYEYVTKEICYSIVSGWTEKVKFLDKTYDLNRYVNFQWTFGRTLLHIAGVRGKLEMVKWLAENYDMSLFVNVQDDNGWTPLHWIVKTNNPETVRYLIAKYSN